MYHPILGANAQRQLKQIGEADLVIGLPTHKNPAAAMHVAKIALAGAHQYYPQLRTVLINADAGMEATTRQAVMTVASNGASDLVVSGRYTGLLGQGSAVAALLDAALALDARAIVILDSRTKTITPDWLAGLAYLIFENKADLVMARYRWPLAEGSLSDLIIYPLFRALWGQSLRHPTAPDFALSPQLAAALLDQDIWETEVAVDGLSPWLTTFAVLGQWRVAQSALGEKQIMADQPEQNRRRILKKQAAQFRARFQHLLSVMLRQVYNYWPYWQQVERFDSLSTLTRFASPALVGAVSSEFLFEFDPAALLDELALGWMEYRPLWQQILNREDLAAVESLAALPFERFYFPCDLWARILYDFCTAFNKGEGDPYQVVNALWPLYRGRLAAFGQEVAGLSLVGYEGTVAAQAVEMEETRSYLQRRWQAYRPA